MAIPAPRNGSLTSISVLTLALGACMQAPDPSEAISGDWQVTGPPAGTAARVSYKLDGGSLHATHASGWSFKAPLEGGEVAVAGRPGETVSVHPVPVVAFRQVFRSDGRPVRIVTVAVVNRNRLVVVEESGGQPPRAMLAPRQ